MDFISNTRDLMYGEKFNINYYFYAIDAILNTSNQTIRQSYLCIIDTSSINTLLLYIYQNSPKCIHMLEFGHLINVGVTSLCNWIKKETETHC